ncbi:DUF397 domain-containing protein [Streptomyces iconiensis]|uniref:DUF397 domain-containing protein n=1 Tax=Streptomyces iconiensis TaxID=1384038 RepID=A0ABT6ZSH6_9ACTN|nr:DUF397 domain-containing protein [Streptomyces iconiensis]MDJ1131739.1 DUF397 domain-containing protein [Streptomyces iconiensis]
MSSELTWFKSSYSDGEGGQCLEVALDWHKSSYSSGEGGACLEVAPDWRKSSHSDGGGGQCVEVAACPATIHVRDSKVTEGPTLAVPSETWATFITHIADR